MLVFRFQPRTTFIGIAWIMLGIALILDSALRAWRAWSVLPNAFPGTIVYYIPMVAVGLVVLLAGSGCVARRSWARLVAIILSPVIFLYSVGSVVSFIFMYFFLEDLPIGHGFRGVVVGAIIAASVPHSFYTFRLMLSQEGRDAFRKQG